MPKPIEGPESDMYDDILVPTDGSDPAIRAAEHGLWLSRAFDATLHVLNVVDVAAAAGPFDAGGLDDEYVERLLDNGRSVVESTVDAVGDPDGVRTDVVRGRPAAAIREYVADRDVDLVAMGTHGRSGIRRYIAGSVAEGVVRRSPVPVFTVRASERSRLDDGYDEVLIPTDGSEHATAAADHGIAIASAADARVHVLHVVDVGAASSTPSITPPTSLMESLRSAGEEAAASVAERARDADLTVTTEVREGFAARDVLAYADESGIDLITMGTAGRTGLDRFLLGSTAETVVSRAEMPVLSATARERDGDR